MQEAAGCGAAGRQAEEKWSYFDLTFKLLNGSKYLLYSVTLCLKCRYLFFKIFTVE
jgi:hypothetical protein